METLLTIVAGVGFAALFIWIGYRRGGRKLPPELTESMRLEKSDPVRSESLARNYFEKIAAQDGAERNELWKRAPDDAAAAEELRRRFLEDLETDAHAQRELRKSASPDLLRTLEESQHTARTQIAKLDAMIRGLRLR